MASTYSPSLKLELIGNGDQSGTWGTTTNNNLGTLLEQAITGVQSIVMSNADYTLTNYNGTSDEARNAVLVVSGTNSAIRKIIAPLVNKTYIIKNATTGNFAITIGGSTGATVTIPYGITAQVYCDGTNFYSSQTGSAGDFTVNGTFYALGAESVTGNLSVGGTLGVTGATSLTTGSISGIMTAPTAAPGTNTTQLATTAFVTAATGTLGTMSTQNANNVNITGGTISGLGTALPVASGGTGASSITANSVVLGNGSSALNGNLVAPSSGKFLVSNGTTWSAQTIAASGAKLGLGITGEVWNNVTSGRSFNSQYQNNYAYPIAVSASTTCSTSARITALVDGSQVAYFGWQFNGCGAYGGTFIIVPPGKTYQLNAGESVQNWVELY
jgi:hypothetical protein